MPNDVIVEDVVRDLKRIQDFDPQDLVQRERLGAEMSFDEIVEPAKRIVSVFRKLSVDAIDEFPARQKQNIQEWSKSAYALFQEVLSFSQGDPDVQQRRDNLIAKVAKAHQNYFDNLFPLISYAVARTVDFDRLSFEGRAAVQAVRDETESLLEELNRTSDEARSVLQEVRDAAAEQGVTQQAKYFSDAAEEHKDAAWGWLIASCVAAVIVVGYAGSTILFRNSPIFLASSTLEAVQIAIGKLLMFIVLAYALIQCVRNYLAHRHNYVTNKHRQNALMTYTTLAEAAGSPEAKEVVLSHAASAIYQPGESGYVKRDERTSGGLPVLSLSPHSIAGQSSASPTSQ